MSDREERLLNGLADARVLTEDAVRLADGNEFMLELLFKIVGSFVNDIFGEYERAG